MVGYEGTPYELEIEPTHCEECGELVQDYGTLMFEVDYNGRRVDVEHECQ
jgi:hypothetical protein